MNSIQLVPGIYTNIFPVELPNVSVSVMIAPRREHQELKPLREKIQNENWNTVVYAEGKFVYGLGSEMDKLAGEGFKKQSISLHDHPRFSCRLIRESLEYQLIQKGYWKKSTKGRLEIYKPQPTGRVANGSLLIYLGYDIRVIWWNTESDKNFGLVVDVRWTFRDSQGNHLNMNEIRKISPSAPVEIAQIQQEYLPNTARINTIVAQQRFRNQIIPFVGELSLLRLSCAIDVNVSSEPIPLILGGEEQ